MRRKVKQKRGNFEITEILKRRNFEADARQGDTNRGISVLMTVKMNLKKVIRSQKILVLRLLREVL